MLRKAIFTVARTLVASAGCTVRRCLCATVVGATFMSGPAMSAEMASFNQPIQGVYADNAAVRGYDIALNKSGNSSSFMFNFILPQDYNRGGKVQIVLYFWQLWDDPCSMRFVPTLVNRGRPGLQLTPSYPGMTPTDRRPTVDLADAKIVQKVYTIDTPRGLREGDWLRVGFERRGPHADDTCPYSVSVLGIDIRYAVAPPEIR